MRSRPLIWLLLSVMLFVSRPPVSGGWANSVRQSDRPSACCRPRFSVTCLSRIKHHAPGTHLAAKRARSPQLRRPRAPHASRITHHVPPFPPSASPTRPRLSTCWSAAHPPSCSRTPCSIPLNPWPWTSPTICGPRAIPALTWSNPSAPLDDAFRARLQAAGAIIVAYIPNQAYLVRASRAAAQQLREDPAPTPFCRMSLTSNSKSRCWPWPSSNSPCRTMTRSICCSSLMRAPPPSTELENLAWKSWVKNAPHSVPVLEGARRGLAAPSGARLRSTPRPPFFLRSPALPECSSWNSPARACLANDLSRARLRRRRQYDDPGELPRLDAAAMSS